MVSDKKLARLKDDVDEALERDEWDSARDEYIKALEERLSAIVDGMSVVEVETDDLDRYPECAMWVSTSMDMLNEGVSVLLRPESAKMIDDKNKQGPG